MATYKVIQDIEADDKLLGPLSLKQFIYFSIALICLYLIFFLSTKGLALAGLLFLPPGAFFGILAVPWSKTQSTEVLILAKIRFWFKPRRRIWDQSGAKELVTVTVPKQLKRNYTDGLDPRQVRNRLSALAQTVDSRGWAVKQLQAAPFGNAADDSDRLVSGTTVQQSSIAVDVKDSDDMLDERSNSRAQQIDQLMSQSTNTRKQQLIDKLHSSASQPQNPDASSDTPSSNTDFWFMSQNAQESLPANMATAASTVVSPHTDPAATPAAAPQQLSPQEEAEILDKIHAKQALRPTHRSHQTTILPLSEQPPKPPKQAPASIATTPPEPPRTQAPDPAILGLANNDDLSVETIAHQANTKREDPPDEVVISLH